MSSEFYFTKWQKTLTHLEELVHLDLNYQATKAHDKKRCEAVERLTAIMGPYMAIYNDTLDCLQHNLQVQKTEYMVKVINALVSRILELKHEIRKLEDSICQFFGNGPAQQKLTPFDVEMGDIPSKATRPEHIQAMVKEVMERVRERTKELDHGGERENEVDEKMGQQKEIVWWEIDSNSDTIIETNQVELNPKISEETLKKRQMIILIQAHEKSRQVTNWVKRRYFKRNQWEKELSGSMPPPAPYNMRQNSARLIQTVLRAFFESKRKKIEEIKRDEILGLIISEKTNLNAERSTNQVTIHRSKLLAKYKEEWDARSEYIKQQYLKRRGGELREEYRDQIRYWMEKWFNEIQYFHDIPNDNEGGLAAIIKEEMPSPIEWLEKYEKYMTEKTANKSKSALQIKWEKMEAKKQEMMLKREEFMKKKADAALVKKIMKNPNLHPGFTYPLSRKTQHILEAIELYRKDWSDLDALDTLDVKEKSVNEINISNACLKAKLEILDSVKEDMRNELKILKTALRNDYIRNNEKMPEGIKKPAKRRTKHRKINAALSENAFEKLEELAVRGFVKEYPQIKLSDFLGDPNFVGEDLRCMYELALPFNGDIRNIWWERCREVSHGFYKILLVGPKGSGKTRLVHALASVNDAILFELDPAQVQGDIFLTPAYLQHLINSVALCAKAVQPSVIHIKDVQCLFYKKVPQEEADMGLDLIKRYFIKTLFRKINKTDKITIIGTCSDPWTTRSAQIFKKFSTVLLLPNTTYSVVVQLLKTWVLSNKVIPKNFDVNSLAYVLQGYSYGYLEDALQSFLSVERILQVSAFGLSPVQVYEYILCYQDVPKTDYDRYLKWYLEKTPWGTKEMKHLGEQREFKRAVERYAEKGKKIHISSAPAVLSAGSTRVYSNK